MALASQSILVAGVRTATTVVVFSVAGLITYALGGQLLIEVGLFEPLYPFLKYDRDPVFNALLAVIGIGMFILSLPLLLLEVFVDRERLDLMQVVFCTALGAFGLATLRLSLSTLNTLGVLFS
jgi:hypothetical protein